MQKGNEEKNRGIPSNKVVKDKALDAAPSFTPGPWRAAERLSGSENHRGWRIVTAKGYAIGEVYPLNEDPSRANARLIAAAPQMYFALQGARAELAFWHSKYPTTNGTANSEAIDHALALANTQATACAEGAASS